MINPKYVPEADKWFCYLDCEREEADARMMKHIENSVLKDFVES